MAQHTPGPWIAEMDSQGDVEITSKSRAGFVEIAQIDAISEGPLKAEQQANVRLIKASPDLLGALVLCLPILESEYSGYGPREPETRAINAAIAAIAAATGATP